MSNFNLSRLVRSNILNLQPYASARSEYQGEAEIFLDANENPFDTGFNRYPDPLQMALKEKIGTIKNCDAERIFLGNGSDAIIDLLFRIFCEPQIDHVITLPPTFGMFKVCADISDVPIVEIPLNAGFQPQIERINALANTHSKILFLCSPNNPTGNSISIDSIKKILERFPGVVVIDEAYIEFSEQESCIGLLDDFENLIVLQTFSKAWGLAGIRLGTAFASPAIVELLNKIKMPYNINLLTQDTIYMALDEEEEMKDWVAQILLEKERLVEQLGKLKCVRFIYPSDANFLLTKVTEPRKIYQHLLNNGIVVRDRSKVILCEDCLRISVGLPDENNFLIEALLDYDFNQSEE